MSLPQRDFALRDILPLVYTNLGQAPTNGDLDPTLFARIYQMILEGWQRQLTLPELDEFWQPVITELRRLRGVPVLVEVGTEDGIRGEQGEDGICGEQGEDGIRGEQGENGIGGEQGEGDVAQNGA